MSENLKKIAKGPNLMSLIKILLKVRKDPFGGLLYIREKYGDFVRVRMPYVAHMISHPDHMKHVFKDNAKNYMKRGQEFYEIEPLLGNGVLLSNGDLWKRQRRTIGAEFTSEAVKDYMPMIKAHAEQLISSWAKERQDGDILEMTDVLMVLTLQIAADCFFGTSVENVKIIGAAVDENATLASKRIRSFIKWPRSWPLPSHRKADETIKKLDGVVYQLIEDYAKNENAKVNVLSRLMLAQTKLGKEELTDKLMRDEIVTILISGHETTAGLLFWTLYCLSENPEIEKKLYDSIVDSLNGCSPNLEDLGKLEYSKKILYETMRLYPAFANLSKQAQLSDTIDGCHIPAGSLMNVCVWLTHRHPDFWENPDLFDPSRFDAEKVAQRHPYAFLPFGKGPRACIGEHFAMLEAQVILVLLVQSYRFSLLEGHDVVPGARITTFPINGIKMRLYKR